MLECRCHTSYNVCVRGSLVRSDSSGKTTLLNRILTEDHGLRIAVIENEFGEVDIDGSLVADQQVRILEKNPWLYTELQNRVRL